MRQPTPAHMPNRCSDRTIDGLSHPPITTITDCRRIHGASLYLEPNLDDIGVPHHSPGSATAVHIGVARCDQRISQRHRLALRLLVKQSIGSLLATAHKPAEVHEENVSHQHPTTATKTARR